MNNIKSVCLGLAVVAGLGLAGNLHAEDEETTYSTQEVLKHPGFREGLVWIGPEAPTEKESAKLLQVIQTMNTPDWPTNVERFLQDNPNSPWAASLNYAYASFCHRTGRTTRALEHWEAGWKLVKDDTSDAGKRLGGEILANWTEQLSSLGRSEKLQELIPAGDRWPFASGQDREKFDSAKRNYYLMSKYPEMSFRCGTLALKAVGQTLQPTNHALESLVEESSPVNGFSVASLQHLSDRFGLNLVAARRISGQGLVVPSVVHWRQNHYAAILDQKDGNFLVNDPTFGKPKWMPLSVINEEASGVFLIPAAKLDANWQILADSEIAMVHGKGLPNTINDAHDKGCSPGATCPTCPGMPVWWVSEPYMNLWIADEPLSYLTSLGEPFTFRISFKQRGPGTDNPYWNPSSSSTFNPWYHSWLSSITLISQITGTNIPSLGSADVQLLLPNGGEVDFPPGQYYDSETRLLIQQTEPHYSLPFEWGAFFGDAPSEDSGINGLRVIHPDGAQDIYGHGLLLGGPADPNDYREMTYMLTRHIDPQGNTTTYYYDDANHELLTAVIDSDGLTNTLSYTNNSHGIGLGRVLSQVTNPYGQSAYFSYDSNGFLTNITDAAGLSSSLTYDTNGYPTSLITPYGTNQFALFVNTAVTSPNTNEGNIGGDDMIDRSVQVTDPTGGNHLYLYRYDCSEFMPTNFLTSDVPTNTPLGTLDTGTGGTNILTEVCYRNSFSWNARQCASLSLTNLAGANLLNLSSNDYARGRMKHWLQDTNDVTLSGSLSVERDPSPDGTIEGLKTFYDYVGKAYPQRDGTEALPSVVAWRLPSGETHYEYVRYDYFGNVTNRVTTYTTASGAWGTRTNQYIYQDNTYTNAFYIDEDGTGDFALVSTHTFTVPNLLTRVIDANGSNVWISGTFDPVAWTDYIFDYSSEATNELVQSSLRVIPDSLTNGAGETTSLAFTGFNKIKTIQWPSGLTTTNTYDANGFLVQTLDVQTHRTNQFLYSTNGLPSVHTNELGLVTSWSWDNLLRCTGVTFPDSTSVSYTYLRLDLSATKDRVGNWTYFYYDGLRHLTTVSNANHAVTSYGWCDCGALTSITNALTNVTSFTYDNQDRLTGISFPDTSSLGYGYDLAGRRTTVSDGSGKSLAFIYNNQGLVTNANNTYGLIAKRLFDIKDRAAMFTDANGVSTTNAYDGLNRLVSRIWTADNVGEGFTYATNGLATYTDRNGHVTHFGRDVAERLTSVTNANVQGTNYQITQFAYDPSGDLTNLTDALHHVTSWNFNTFGWATDKVDATNREIFRYYYDTDGRLTNRWMLGSGDTAYAYDAVGNLTNIIYSNSPTAAVHLAYDPVNRLTNMQDAVGTTLFGYTAVGQLASEAGPWTSNSVLSGYTQSHRTSLTLLQPSGGSWSQSYLYDAEWRMTNVTSSAGSFAYTYPTNASALIQSLHLPNAASVNYGYDSLARLATNNLNNYWGHVLDGYVYGYDYVGQRTGVTRNLGLATNAVTAGYDNIGQLTSWSAVETNSALRFNEQLGYGYDAAGNLNLRTNNTLVQTFTVDTLNQLSTVTRSGAVTLTGATPAPATNITVNGNAAQRYADFTFARTNLTLTSGTNTFTNIAQNAYGQATTNTLTINLPSSVSFSFDNNGNLTSDGTRNFVYDAENQLTNVYVTNQWKTEFVYDGLRRKRITKDYTWSSGWVKTNETRYICDGMLPIQERDSNNVVRVTYTRGLDLSGSVKGAGGIGGLLARNDANGPNYYHADGAGNVTAMMDGNQNITARYEYDPTGKLIGEWGTNADANTYRFSSKEYQRNSGLYSYGYRFYEPNFQRWLNHDPIQEWGGVNLYGFVGNSPLNRIDPFGWSDNNRPPGTVQATLYYFPYPTTVQYGPPAPEPRMDREPNGGAYDQFDSLFSSYMRDHPQVAQAVNDLDEGANNVTTILGMLDGAGELAMAKNLCAEETTPLYRAVMDKELKSIEANKGALTPGPGGLEVKYFTTSAEDAAAYAKQAFGKFGEDSPYTIIKTEAPGGLVPGVTVDSGIPTITIPNSSLPSLSPAQILNSTPIPK